MTGRPRQSLAGLWNISFGFFGIQVAFGLQNANISRIFQSLGSDVDTLALLWIAGPITGLIVQPLIGHFSDRTWGRFGRRRPYFLAGAALAALALIAMPHAPVLLVAALLLWMLDGSINISMEPFRAFVGDMVGPAQRTLGYAFQTAFIGAGAVLGSIAPFAITALGASNVAPAGVIPDAVRYSFYLGGAAIFCAVLWTVLTTREYPPETMRAFAGEDAPARDAGQGGNALTRIARDIVRMPVEMRRLALVQFFSWSALFVLWVYTTPVVTRYAFAATDTASQAYNDGADWVGILFSVYNGVAALAAFLLPGMVRRIGMGRTHMVCLLIGAAGFAAMLVIRDPVLLILPMIAIGIAWASILTIPYAMLAGVLPHGKLGVYMGIFNVFIVLPQLFIATVMGSLIHNVFPEEPIWTIAIAGALMALSALAMLRVGEPATETTGIAADAELAL
ncbi:MAG: MFS transporter [Pseudomonadota bacterium]|uniref:Predicted maltose transporter MalT n=1 Tax=hydrothermal vent metagenome TaxID=652676 RepID=A0A160TGJ8_9ZZZZ